MQLNRKTVGLTVALVLATVGVANAGRMSAFYTNTQSAAAQESPTPQDWLATLGPMVLGAISTIIATWPASKEKEVLQALVNAISTYLKHGKPTVLDLVETFPDGSTATVLHFDLTQVNPPAPGPTPTPHTNKLLQQLIQRLNPPTPGPTPHPTPTPGPLINPSVAP